MPAGHPEGYLEAFAQIYSDSADLILKRRDVKNEDWSHLGENAPVPSVEDGIAGMKFINAAVNSSLNGGRWQMID